MTINGMTENLSAADKTEIAAAMARGRRMMPDFPPDLMLNTLITARFDALGLPLERAEALAAAEIAAMRRRAPAEALARAGRRGDRAVGHLTPGEMVVPKALLDRDPALKEKIVAALGAAGLDWRRYEVGGADDSINPATGLWEYYGDFDEEPAAASPGGIGDADRAKKGGQERRPLPSVVEVEIVPTGYLDSFGVWLDNMRKNIQLMHDGRYESYSGSRVYLDKEGNIVEHPAYGGTRGGIQNRHR